MKLYTKKMTYSLLAIGLLAGSPVDAFVHILMERWDCERICRGYFVDEANKKKITGVIKKGDIEYKSEQVEKRANPSCRCKYKGGLGIKKSFFPRPGPGPDRFNTKPLNRREQTCRQQKM